MRRGKKESLGGRKERGLQKQCNLRPSHKFGRRRRKKGYIGRVLLLHNLHDWVKWDKRSFSRGRESEEEEMGREREEKGSHFHAQSVQTHFKKKSYLLLQCKESHQHHFFFSFPSSSSSVVRDTKSQINAREGSTNHTRSTHVIRTTRSAYTAGGRKKEIVQLRKSPPKESLSSISYLTWENEALSWRCNHFSLSLFHNKFTHFYGCVKVTLVVVVVVAAAAAAVAVAVAVAAAAVLLARWSATQCCRL